MGFVRNQRLPFCIFKKDGTWHIRHLPSQFCQMIYSPRHHHINGKTILDSLCTAQLSLLYPATAFQYPVIYFYPPSQAILLQFLRCLLKYLYLAGRQQHPFQCLHPVRNLCLFGIYCTYRQFSQLFLALRWSQRYFCKSYL